MHGRLLLLLTALALARIGAQATGQQLDLLVGAGCHFSNYSTLPVATATKPSSRLELDPGLGHGVYVLHFTQFHLPEPDVLVVRGSDALGTTPAAVLGGKNATGTFYSAAIAGTGVVLELFKTVVGRGKAAPTACHGFTVTGLLFTPQALVDAARHQQGALDVPLAHVPNATKAEDTAPRNTESLCGKDESVAAACAPSATNSPAGALMLATSQPVARLAILKENGLQLAYCTGWLLGCDGHVLTNQHCISNEQDALNTHVEFLAQSKSCGGSETCDTQGACPGPVGITSTTLVAVSEELDYALVRLGLDTTASDFSRLYAKTNGYLQFRASGPVPGETIYIPQYPLGHGKRLAWLFNGQPGRVESLNVSECREGDVGYYVDTQEGSSGSPLLALRDHHVIAMHHCGGCLNGAIPAPAIIADLTSKGVLPNCSIANASRLTGGEHGW
ncbi:hypothetical protein PsorP6_016166 [Peronosclerospora sorghi]|uniref:Uncharacterized protein n=1 Tax=Peronosclerospora sorghi TaxID=230839 RepID=A0ACC0VR42_9STRA|nr:hypothetical protein PsorP6_016166 [Peronosclerospora sorghi]